jgi:outer membrane autotransporter protein
LSEALGAFAAVGLLLVASTSPGHAQAPFLGTVATFAVLGGSTVTNTGPTVLTGTAALPGNLGVSPGSAITGFFAVDGGPGILTGPGASIHQNDAVAIQAQINLINAYNNLAARPTSVNLTGQNLGGLTLVPGTYNFSSAAQLTGALTLNGLGNPNSVFIFNIGSTLTTASASSILLINGAQGGDVFWRVGSSATLGTASSFTGDILALTSITLDTSATITCGAAWAHTGAVTLDSNTISLCNLIAGSGGSGGAVIGPSGFPLFTSLLPAGASANDFSVATGLDNAVNHGVTLPMAFLNLFNLSPSALANALTQLSGEVGTAAAPAGMLAMDSFLLLLTSPFADSRDVRPPPPLVYKDSLHPVGYAVPEPSRWGIWAAGYGGQNNSTGDPSTGSNDRSARAYGSIIGLDYWITPHTMVGAAVGGGGTSFGLSDGLGGGHSDMFQSALYSFTRLGAAYVAAALAYDWQSETTGRLPLVAGGDPLSAGFAANNIGGRVEGGYRLGIGNPFGLPDVGFIPYGALQMQAFRTPSYNETGAAGLSPFALAYAAQTTTMTRTELGAWLDGAVALDNGTILALRTRAAWAHDHWSGVAVNAAFQELPGSGFTVVGAIPAQNSLITSVGAEIAFRNGFSVAALLDSELSSNTQTYIETLRVRYIW